MKEVYRLRFNTIYKNIYIPHFAVHLNKQCCDHQLVSGKKKRKERKTKTHFNKQKNCPRRETEQRLPQISFTPNYNAKAQPLNFVLSVENYLGTLCLKGMYYQRTTENSESFH